MFLRPNHRSKDGKGHTYWSLVETVRTADGPRQKTLCYLGELNSSAQARWLRTVEVFNDQGEAQQLKLFPSQVEPPPEDPQGLVFRGGRGSVPEKLVESSRYVWNWPFANRTISAPITPMKSARWEPNWSFANHQGSWFKGGGSRNGSGGDGVCVARRSIRQAMA